MDAQAAYLIIGVAIGILLGAVPVYAAWQSDVDQFEQGRRDGRTEAVRHLRAQADLHAGHVGDARRRGALNLAAAQIEASQSPGRRT